MSGVQLKKVGPDEDGMRLDRWFKTHFPAFRHGQLEKALSKGQIRVDGGRVKANRRLAPGEEIRVPPIPDSTISETRITRKPSGNPGDADALRSLIIYEDDVMMAINKPFGLAVQGGTNIKRHVDGMLVAYGGSEGAPRLIHRLDKDTGGLMLIAKTRISAQKLGDAFKNHTIDKTYWALTAGVPMPREGTIDMPIAKKMVRLSTGDREQVVPAEGERGKKAITDYQIMDEAGPIAFVAFRPVTGRTHQIRVHGAAIECPIVGDGKYGGAAAHIEGVSSRMHLFCRAMTFEHPKSGKPITLTAPLTEHMDKTWTFFNFDKKVQTNWPGGLR